MSAASERLKAVLATSPAHAEWEAVNTADLRELLAEITRLRSLVEEAGKVVEPLALLAETLHSLTPDRQARVMVMKRITAARSLLTKLKEG